MKAFRETIGLSQKEFAEHFGLPIRTLQEWEQGRRKPPEYVIEMIKKIWELEKQLKNCLKK